MSLKRRPSRLHGPRPSPRPTTPTNSSEKPGINELLWHKEYHELDLPGSTSITLLITTESSDRSTPLVDSTALCRRALQNKAHIHCVRRHQCAPRPLPIVPESLHRRSYSTSALPQSSPSSLLRCSPARSSSLRRLPVPPLPLTMFPAISPTAATPAPRLSYIEYSPLQDVIDWDLIDEILRSSR